MMAVSFLSPHPRTLRQQVCDEVMVGHVTGVEVQSLQVPLGERSAELLRRQWACR